MRYLTTLIVFTLLLVACGGEGGEEDTATTSNGDTQADATTTAAQEESEVAGAVTIGDDTWEFSPTGQCLVSQDQVSIWGSAVANEDVEIVFDVFGEGDYNLSLTGPDFEWLAGAAGGGTVESVTIEGTSVSGTATVGGLVGGETAEASFEFNC